MKAFDDTTYQISAFGRLFFRVLFARDCVTSSSSFLFECVFLTAFWISSAVIENFYWESLIFFFEKSLVHIGHLTDFFGLLSME